MQFRYTHKTTDLDAYGIPKKERRRKIARLPQLNKANHRMRRHHAFPDRLTPMPKVRGIFKVCGMIDGLEGT
jgi:hypothetical protein